MSKVEQRLSSSKMQAEPLRSTYLPVRLETPKEQHLISNLQMCSSVLSFTVPWLVLESSAFQGTWFTSLLYQFGCISSSGINKKKKKGSGGHPLSVAWPLHFEPCLCPCTILLNSCVPFLLPAFSKKKIQKGNLVPP